MSRTTTVTHSHPSGLNDAHANFLNTLGRCSGAAGCSRHFRYGSTRANGASSNEALAAVTNAPDNNGSAAQPATAGIPSVGLPNFKDIIKRNQASVVNISTTHKVEVNQMQGLPPGFEEFFRQFRGMPGQGFGPFGSPDSGPGSSPPKSITRESNSLGSGFIISADGKILTNAHVVDGADEIVVKLADNTEKKAKVIGIDSASDVALLKIDASGLQAVKLGDSSQLEVGDWVLAIGSPFGLEHTATQGIVSALGRSLPDGNYVPFIQTDVAVNPGNSGGPLFNTRGEVVGINSQIYSRSGGYMGLSFAIPINTASSVEQQLAANGRVDRGWLGIGIQGMNGELATSFGLEKPEGALIGKVDDDGPAAKAGLKPGDVILAYDGHPIEHSADLPPLVGETKPGTTVPLKVWRDHDSRQLKVTVARLKTPDDEQLANNSGDGDKPGALNVQVAPLTPEQRQQAGIESGGVLVIGVDEGPAERAGVNSGDVILALNNKPVNSPKDLVSLTRKLPKDRPVPLLVQRGDARLFLPLSIPG
ncbi:MAG: DegQ family serine endoprotease [Gammaproteobacteria bacterium]